MHSQYQLDHFVVGRGNWTPYAKLRQCEREIDSRSNSLRSLKIEIEETEIAGAKAVTIIRVLRWLRWAMPYAYRRARLRLQSLELKHNALKRQSADTRTELARLEELRSQLRDELGPLTPEQAEREEATAWIERLRLRALLEARLCGTVSPNTAETILSMPLDDQIAALADVSERLLEGLKEARIESRP